MRKKSCAKKKMWHASSQYHSERGFALFTTLIVVVIIGIIAISNQSSTEMTEILAGNSIQRSRAFQAAEGGIAEGEKQSIEQINQRVFSSPSALVRSAANGGVTIPVHQVCRPCLMEHFQVWLHRQFML